MDNGGTMYEAMELLLFLAYILQKTAVFMLYLPQLTTLSERNECNHGTDKTFHLRAKVTPNY